MGFQAFSSSGIQAFSQKRFSLRVRLNVGGRPVGMGHGRV